MVALVPLQCFQDCLGREPLVDEQWQTWGHRMTAARLCPPSSETVCSSPSASTRQPLPLLATWIAGPAESAPLRAHAQDSAHPTPGPGTASRHNGIFWAEA